MRRNPLPFSRAALAFSVALSSFGLATIAKAGAWTEADGEGRAILTLRGATADDYFDSAGDEAAGPTFRKDGVELYVTYGVTDTTTLVVQTAYVDLHPDSPAASASGWDETQIGVQHQIWATDDQVFSAQLSLLAPGNRDLTSGGADWEARALYGQAFQMFGRPAFIDLELAYRWRANGYADQLRPELTLGVWVEADLMVMAQSFNTFTTTSGADQYFEGEQSKVQLSAVYRVSEDVALQFGAFTTVDGANTPAERGALAALWFDF